jgi:tape measure domain-containing protein
MNAAVAYALQLKDQISGALASAQAAVARFEAKLSGVQRQADKTSSGLGKLGLAASAAFGAYKILEFGKALVTAGADMEATRLRYEVFTGSAKKAGEAIDVVAKLATKTPFAKTELLEYGQQLLGAGLSTDQMGQKLTTLGNISSATGKNLGELTSLYVKNRGNGIIQGEDLNQLADAKIPLQDFAKLLGTNVQGLRKMASQGKVSFADLDAYFEKLGGTQGKWGKLNERMSNTLVGKWSNLKDTIGQMMSDNGEATVPFAKTLLDKANEVLQWVQTNKAKFAQIFEPLQKAVQPLIDSFRRVTESMGYTGTVSDMLEKVFNRVGYAVQVMSPFIEVAAMVFGKVYEAVSNVINIFVKYFQTNKEAQANVLGLYNTFKTAFSLIGDVAGKVLGGIVKAIDGIINRDWSKLGRGLKEIVASPFEAATNKDNYHFNDKAPVFKDFFGDKGKSATDAARAAAAGAKNALGTSAATGKDKGIKTKVGDVSGSKPTNVYVTIQKLTGVETLHTVNLKETTADIQKLVTELLLAGITDFSLLAGKN